MTVRTIALVTLAGIAAGVWYVLSPLSVICVLAISALVRWAAQGLDDGERRWVVAVLVTAVVARVLVVLGLFLLTDHHQVPFGHLFGDEEYFIRRAIWMRNLVLGVPMHRADVIYAYDHDIRTSFLAVLATLQLLFGAAPYGAHLFSIVCYVGASIVLYRLVRPSFGRLPALLGLATVLFLPTLFAWSVSALKEPFYFLTTSVGLAAAVTVARPGPSLRRIGALAVVAASALLAQSIREGGLAMAAGGAAVGLAAGGLWRTPRLLLPLAVLALLAAPLAASQGAVKDRIVAATRHAAAKHRDQVNTPGFVYAVLDRGFYARPEASAELTLRQGVHFVLGSLAAYLVVPLPWTIQSRTALLYLPEQVIWYLMLVLLPVGLVGGFRRDAGLAALLAGYAATAAVLVALTSGNVGTLVRHRGLAVPYLLWLSVLGACDLAGFVTAFRQDLHAHDR
jgi:4-amino-4-deoxy-L-arabinose transferase-like glycosyltransferase